MAPNKQEVCLSSANTEKCFKNDLNAIVNMKSWHKNRVSEYLKGMLIIVTNINFTGKYDSGSNH